MEQYECPFAVGDIVVFMEPSEHDKARRPGWNGTMERMVGSTAVVERIAWDNDCGSYLIRCDNGRGSWKDTWLQNPYSLF